ncbi:MULTISPECIES: hypothetical protein [Sphingobacterium]|uniref:hypothetical protein n=1 Tax=Sphingobacterium TaxID=28453 RepID=UPI002579CC0A|nr:MULTISPECIES: hypothetical protein [Sphingobacterium]
MNDQYTIFKNDELVKSRILAQELNISNDDFEKIQCWFDLLLWHHEQLTSNTEEQFNTEKKLEILFNEIVSSEIESASHKYILPKLLHYNNAFNGAFLRSLYIARLGSLLQNNLIPKFVDDKNIVFSAEDFLHTSEYLKYNYFVSPNSNFLEDILKIQHVRGIFKRASPRLKFETVKNISLIISQIEYHHNIICFKKILKLVTEKDNELIDYLKEFQVENRQGCYKIISDILSLYLSENIWNDFEIKVALIHFLDTGRGTNPSASWNKKLQELCVSIGASKLLQISSYILDNDNCKNYNFPDGLQWSDDTAKRFLKSAKWIKTYI